MEKHIIDLLGKLVPCRESAKIRRDGSYYVAMAHKDPVMAIINPTANRILELCDGIKTVEQVILEFRRENLFVAPDVITSDVISTLRQLESQGLVTLKTPSDS